MPQSYSRALMHLVFSTKNRDPLITPHLRPELFPYMFGIVKGIGCEPVQVGGMGDHVHILLGLSRTLTIADTVKTIKTSSTGWLKDERNIARFAWQTGYAIASVNAGDSGDVVRYIQNQEEHHQKVDFKAEYRKFLDDNGIEYNDLYIWD